MVKYKRGALVKEVTKGAEKWYKLAGWEKVGASKEKTDGEFQKETKKNDKTDTEKTTTA